MLPRDHFACIEQFIDIGFLALIRLSSQRLVLPVRGELVIRRASLVYVVNIVIDLV